MECVTALLWRASEWLRAARWLSGPGGKDVFWSLSLKFQQYSVFFSSCHSIMNLSLKELLQKHNWLRYHSNQAPSINQSGLFFNYIPLKQMFYIPTVPSFSSTCTANTVKLKKCLQLFGLGCNARLSVHHTGSHWKQPTFHLVELLDISVILYF